MNYFILTYQVIINGNKVELAKVGRVVPDLDYTPNAIRDRIKDVYIKKHSTNNIAVKLHEKRQVTPEQFEIEASSFNVQLEFR